MKNDTIFETFGIINNPNSTALQKAQAEAYLLCNMEQYRVEDNDTFYFYDSITKYNSENMKICQFVGLEKYPSTTTKDNYTLHFSVESHPQRVIWILAKSISFKNKDFVDFLRRIQKGNDEQYIVFKNALRHLNLSKRQS